MSKANLSTEVKNLGRVLVRGFEGHPSALQARRIGKQIQVFRKRTAMSLGYPANLVYQFDEGLYTELLSAYEESRWDDLERAWSRAVLLSDKQDSDDIPDKPQKDWSVPSASNEPAAVPSNAKRLEVSVSTGAGDIEDS